MSVIKPRAVGQKTDARLITKLKADNHATLVQYAAWLKEDVGYVLDQLIETVLAKDKDFITGRETALAAIAAAAAAAAAKDAALPSAKDVDAAPTVGPKPIDKLPARQPDTITKGQTKEDAA